MSRSFRIPEKIWHQALVEACTVEATTRYGRRTGPNLQVLRQSLEEQMTFRLKETRPDRAAEFKSVAVAALAVKILEDADRMIV